MFSVHIFTFKTIFIRWKLRSRKHDTRIQQLSRLVVILVGQANRFRGTVADGLAIAMVTGREAGFKCLQKTSPF